MDFRNWRVLPVLILLALRLDAATYYLSPTGSDTNSGSATYPWRTPNRATNSPAGTTIVFKPGVYTNATYVQPKYSGGATNPITFRAETLGTVTNHFGFWLTTSNVVIEGMEFADRPIGNSTQWYLGRCIYLDRTAGWVTVSNCTMNYSVGAIFVREPPVGYGPERTAKFCTFAGNTIHDLTNVTMVTLQGVGHVIDRNTLFNGWSCDAFRIFGSNTVIRANSISNICPVAGASNHPDILQTFGDNGYWMTDFVFERNHVVDCPVQLMDFSFKSTTVQDGITVPTNSWQWGILVRNNLFENSTMQSSIDIPNVRFFNNTFYRCDAGSSALLYYTFYNPEPLLWSAYRGNSYGGYVVNNAFIECGGAYASNPVDYNIAQLTNGAGTVKGWTSLRGDSGRVYVTGTSTNLTGTPTSGMIVMGGIDCYPIDATNFTGATGTYKTSVAMTEGAGGLTVNQQWGHINNGRLGFRLMTAANPSGEVAGSTAKWVPDPPMDTFTNSGYNFLSLGDYSAKSGWSELGGLNGGYPALVGYETNATTLRRLTKTSVLRSAGLATDDVTEDYWGQARQNPPSIGCFEYDPHLKLWLDFDEGFASSNAVADVTGNGGDAWQMDSTNWITSTNGMFRTTAGAFRYTGTLITNDPPHVYKQAQYAAVTNVAAFSNLTAGTIGMWLQFGSNTDYQMSVLDSAYDARYAGSKEQASNSWSIARNATARLAFNVAPAGVAISSRITWPNDVVQSGGSSPLLNTLAMHHYAVTFSVTNNEVIGYYDGQPFATNTLGVPYLTIYGKPNRPWLAVGTMAHEGTPGWMDGTDPYPNGEFFVGRMDDVKIFDRQLSAAEIASLGAGGGYAEAAVRDPQEGGEDPEPGVSPTIVTQPANAVCLVGGTATFTVTATGTAPLLYTWRFNREARWGESTAATLAIPNVSTNWAGSWDVVVENAYGTVTSDAATLTVEVPVSQPKNGLLRGSGRFVGSGFLKGL